MTKEISSSSESSSSKTKITELSFEEDEQCVWERENSSSDQTSKITSKFDSRKSSHDVFLGDKTSKKLVFKDELKEVNKDSLRIFVS